MKNQIRLRINAAGLQFMNPTTHKWQPCDASEAGLMLHNVLDYDNLPLGVSVDQ